MDNRRDRDRRIRRQRQRDLGIRLDQLVLARAPAGPQPMLVQVIRETTVPTATDRYFACRVVDPGGAEGEATAPTFTTDGSGNVYVLVIGNRPPVEGDYLVAFPVGGRWVAESGGGEVDCVDQSSICGVVTDDGCAWAIDVNFQPTITVKDSTGAVVGSVTAAGVVVSIALLSAGSGYTDGTGYALGFTGGGGSGAAGTFDVVGGVVQNIQLTAGGSGYTSAPTVDVTAAGAGTGASISATVRPMACVLISHSGRYTVECSYPGTTTLSQTIYAVCGMTPNYANFAYPANTFGGYFGAVSDPCDHGENGGNHIGDIPGATVTCSIGGVTIATTTTDLNGDFLLSHIPQGAAHIVASKDNYEDAVWDTGGLSPCRDTFLGTKNMTRIPNCF